MAAAALAFAFALLLRADTPHVAWWFGVVCGATGLLLGAEWMLPQSVVATRLAKLSQSEQAGRVFGIWTWAQKMALAIATGVALWGLAVLGYVPGNASSNTVALIALYCLAPALMKMVAAWAAWQLAPQEIEK
jgi:Na+/melibiose symporter-like transporter